MSVSDNRKAALTRILIMNDKGRYHSYMVSRSFSSQFDETANRSVDDDAPLGLRQEFVDTVYFIFERSSRFDEKRLHNIIVQSLGVQPSGTPYAGFRYAIGREVNKASWQRFYDLIIRLDAEIPPIFQPEYRDLVNQLLASYRIVWELREDHHLHRVLPTAIGEQFNSTFRELGQPRFAAAFASFNQGMAAYDDRPQRGKDACKNIFDALEATAKTVGNMPTATFGNVLTEIRKAQYLSSEIIASLQKLYDLANNHFRHGTTSPFVLKPVEIDYFIVSCCGAILLFVRM